MNILYDCLTVNITWLCVISDVNENAK